jgi:dihydrolipoamide dehydrogenase
MKEYDLVAIGTGSTMNIVEAFLKRTPRSKLAVLATDEPGGICLTRGCIPTKILVYPAELIRTIEESKTFGIDIDVKTVNFKAIMDRMRSLIYRDIDMIRAGLSNASNLDYYNDIAEFIAPYTLKVGNETVKSPTILLCTGSKPLIPSIQGIETVGYLTSDTILKINHLPESIAIIGGGYVAAELGHFLSAMGSKVTIIGRNPQFLKQEEPEVSALALQLMQKHMTIYTNHEVQKAERTPNGKKLIAVNRATKKTLDVYAEEILVATGRASNVDILHPERAGIQIDRRGWITVNDHLETSQANIWALGDANGRYLFKHVANYESLIVYYNAILKRDMTVDYHAIPHAVFTYPEIASVGLKESEAMAKFGEDGVLIGMHRYQDTAKGEAMDAKEYFVKVLVQKGTMKILGAHIIGPYASILVQEIINLMYTPDQSAMPILNGMYIHPALNEVVQRAFNSLMSPTHYHHLLNHR